MEMLQFLGIKSRMFSKMFPGSLEVCKSVNVQIRSWKHICLIDCDVAVAERRWPLLTLRTSFRFPHSAATWLVATAIKISVDQLGDYSLLLHFITANVLVCCLYGHIVTELVRFICCNQLMEAYFICTFKWLSIQLRSDGNQAPDIRYCRTLPCMWLLFSSITHSISSRNLISLLVKQRYGYFLKLLMLTLWGSFGVAGFIRKFCFLSVGSAREGAAQAAAGMLLLCGFPSAASEICTIAHFVSTMSSAVRRVKCGSSDQRNRIRQWENQPWVQFEAWPGEKHTCAHLCHRLKDTRAHVFVLNSNSNAGVIL